MNCISKLAALALAFAGGVASATTVNLGTGPGSYQIGDSKDVSYAITLEPGRYTFEADVDVLGTLTLNDVWLSFGKDKQSDRSNDIGEFMKLSTGNYGGKLTAMIGATTPVYLNIDALVGHKTSGSFRGSLTVTPAVPEPSSIGLMLAGAAGLAFLGRRRRKSA